MKKKRTIHSSRKLIWRNRAIAYAFLLPNIVGFLLFTFIPVVMSLWLSLVSWNGFNEKTFVGLENFRTIWSDETFRISLKNTLLYSIMFVPSSLILSLAVSVALNNGIRGVKAFRTMYFLPYITATIACAAVWQLIFHPTMGPINNFLRALGMSEPPSWLGSSKWALTSVTIVSVWKQMGYYIVIFLAGLQGVPRDLYEAADLDGANGWQKFINVTAPMLSPVIFFASIMAVINSFKIFDMVYSLTDGGPGRATNVLVYAIYTEAFRKYRFGSASAMAYVLFAIIMIVTLIQFRGQKKWVNY